VVDEDWQTLFVIDGCRADLFEETVDTEGFNEYRQINSGVSATPEWIDLQFHGAAHSDIIYITGNPVVSENVPTSFYRFEEPWREHFDEDVQTVRPEPIAQYVREIRDEHPDKRIVAHFNQPHYPFITRPDLQFKGRNRDETNVWAALRAGLVEKDDVWDAYTENLEAVMDVVQPLAEELDEQTVITSDHGNLVGERIWPVPLRQWGHPIGIRHPNVTTVPWAVIGEGVTERVEDAVGEQLKALGYREEDVQNT